MLDKKDRQKLEITLLVNIQNNSDYFLQLYNKGYSDLDLFTKLLNRGYYQIQKECYENKNLTPNKPDFYNYLIKNHSEYKEYYENLIMEGKPTDETDTEYYLIEDTIEREVNQSYSRAKKYLTGLKFAEDLQENISDIITEKYHSYIVKEKNNREMIEELFREIEQGGSGNYIETKIQQLDEKIGGIPKGHLSIIAARPGMGKTAFMLQLKRNLIEQGYKIGIISIEMSAKELMIRELSSINQIDSLDIEKTRLSQSQIDDMKKNSVPLLKENYIIDDSSSQTVETVKATVRKWKQNKGIDIVFVDYLTLIHTETKERYDLEIGRLCSNLRGFAKAEGLPIVLLSQLNRMVESRANKRPKLSDIRESGQIEQDAKVVMFLYNPSQYGIDPKTDNSFYDKLRTIEGEEVPPKEYSEIIVAKARGGNTGIVSIRYIKNIHTFENLTTVIYDL